jgi:hypothetical protein
MSISDKARKIPGVAAVEGAVTGALATEQDLPITDYDRQTAADVVVRLKQLSQRELRARKDRAGVIQAADQRLGD